MSHPTYDEFIRVLDRLDALEVSVERAGVTLLPVPPEEPDDADFHCPTCGAHVLEAEPEYVRSSLVMGVQTERDKLIADIARVRKVESEPGPELGMLAVELLNRFGDRARALLEADDAKSDD